MYITPKQKEYLETLLVKAKMPPKLRYDDMSMGAINLLIKYLKGFLTCQFNLPNAKFPKKSEYESLIKEITSRYAVE